MMTKAEAERVDPRRSLPSVSALLDAADSAGVLSEYGRELVTVHARSLLDILRADPDLKAAAVTPPALVERLASTLSASEHPIRRVINATGVFLHTNLGRAPLPDDVVAQLAPLSDAGCDLEVDLSTGRRGDRNARVNRTLCELTGAPAALVVNNNAAALVLVLRTLAAGKDVVVSRGELVEIGGSFRIPDILSGAGARLVEVGTTNRTRIADYEAAITDETGLLLKVYPSNYRIRGFTEEASTEQLVALAKTTDVPLLVDEGSGLLRSRPESPFADHGSIEALLAQGCDLVCGSGDKVLGASQAGLLLGQRALIEACHRSPLYRALRPSRMTLVTLGAVLERHRRGRTMPLDRLFEDEPKLRARLESWLGFFEQGCLRENRRPPLITIVSGEAFVGGGSAPEAAIEGPVLAVETSQAVAERLRTGPTPVMGRLHQGRLMLDLRTVSPKDDEAVAEALWCALSEVAVPEELSPTVQRDSGTGEN